MPATRRFAVLLIDVLLIVLATFSALLLRENFEPSFRRFLAFLPYLGFSTVVAMLALSLIGLDRSFWRFSSTAVAARVSIVAVVVVIGAVSLTFVLNRLEDIARTLPLLQCLLIIVYMLGARTIARMHYRFRQRPMQLRDTPPTKPKETELVVGLNWLCDAYVRSVDEFGGSNRVIAGVLGRQNRHVGRMIRAYEVLGTPENVEYVIQSLAVHGVVPTRIVVTCRPEELSSEANSAIRHAAVRHNLTIEFLIDRMGLADGSIAAPIDVDDDFAAADAHQGIQGSTFATPEASGDKVAADPAVAKVVVPGPGPAFVLSRDELQRIAQRPYWPIKRAIDFSIALVGMIVAAPLFVIAALLTWVNVGRPIFFWQQRPGLCGQPFDLYKFRTLGKGIDAFGERIPDSQRLSLIGKLMRSTRFDELPQLYNILIGDMSIVGPRPLLPVDQAPEFHARLLVRPGLAGWAQIRGGRDIHAADKAALDVWYLRNASLWLDLKILLLTIPIILFGERVSRASIEQAWTELKTAGVVRGGEDFGPGGAAHSI